MAAVLLIDGVGNAVSYERAVDVLSIEIHDHRIDKMRRFEKMREYWDGMDCYRLAGSWKPSGDGLWPPVRHVNRHLATA